MTRTAKRPAKKRKTEWAWLDKAIAHAKGIVPQAITPQDFDRRCELFTAWCCGYHEHRLGEDRAGMRDAKRSKA